MALPENVELPDKAKILSEGIFNGNSTPTFKVDVEAGVESIRVKNTARDEHRKTDVFFWEVSENIFYYAVYETPVE